MRGQRHAVVRRVRSQGARGLAVHGGALEEA